MATKYRLNNLLKEIAKEYKSNAEIAKKIGISAQYFSDIVNCRNSLSLEQFEIFLAKLDKKIDEIIISQASKPLNTYGFEYQAY